MKTNLVTYLTHRYYKDEQRKTEPGPVITISREYGCPAKSVAQKLSEAFNTKLKTRGLTTEWRWVSKEILLEAAKALQVSPEEIQYVFDYEQKGILDDILKAQGQRYYKNDRKIRNTIGNVIRSFGIQGNVIIVGRAGVVLTKDIPRSLHVNLEAPLDWRTVRTSEKQCLDMDKARKYALDMDKKREQFRDYYVGKGTDYTRFDISLNCMMFTVDEIVDILFSIAEIRKLV
jgi:cytidylate kinase